MPIYQAGDLHKVNAMRKNESQPDLLTIPHLHDADVMFTRAAEMGNKPSSCYTCHFRNCKDDTCALITPNVKIRKVQRNGIEYWPCCGMHDYGECNDGPPNRCSTNSPDTLGLIWINAPYTGANYGGASCGGQNAGDDCDHYIVEGGKSKRDCPTGFCRVLQHTVANGDTCVAWHDDDILGWQEAQNLIQGPEEQRDKKRLVDSIMKRED